MGQCYGFFEIPSVTAAIDAVDIMCKTADVEMITWEKKLGGRLVTIIIRGDVSAVTQAIEAAAANGIKEPVCYTVIPSPHEEIYNTVTCRKKENNCSQSASQNGTESKEERKKGRAGGNKSRIEGGTKNGTGSIRNG